MEIHDWAQSILSADTLEGKLSQPAFLTDDCPGPPIIWSEPTRPPGMGFSRRSRTDKLPPLQELGDLDKRAICLHRFAGHELLAVEIMAFTLLAFPEAPRAFRKGLAHTLKEEQGHVRLYVTRLEEMGVHFGDMPLYKHFWKYTAHIQSPLHYVSTMSLTFEMANLDFAPLYGHSFARFGDTASATLMAQILRDEIAHVRFGWRWLDKFKENHLSSWDVWENTLASVGLVPKRAVGFCVQSAARQQAGIPEEWITKLKRM